MRYILSHKNTEVLMAEFNPETNSFNAIIDISNEAHIPVGLKTMPGTTLTAALNFWWQSRLIPKNRSKFKNKMFDLSEYFKDSNGFNLTDHYWIKSENSDMTWSKGNFLQNNFNEDIGKYLVTENTSSLSNMKSNTPDLFSNGDQDKRWVIVKNERRLLKYGSPPYYEQPFNEMLATEICRRLEIPHVSYSFVVKGYENPIIYSSCSCFIDENTEYIPAGFIQYVQKKEKGTSEYQHILNCCKALGMENIEEIKNRITEMNIIDYITANTDRHYGNFGFIRDVNTLEWKGFAPIFDTGNAMFYDYPTSDLRKSTALMDNVVSKNFAQTQKKQIIKYANQEAKICIDFLKLKGIENYYHSILETNPKSDKERTDLLTNLLAKRIQNVQRLIFFNNDITKKFLTNIKKNNKNISFIQKIAEERKNMEAKSSDNSQIIDKYLRNLNPLNSNELEELIKKDINTINQKQKTKNTITQER